MIALLVASLIAAEPALVLVRSDDEALTGAVALALVEDGAIVTPEAAEATHELTVAARDGGYLITCLGAETKGAVVGAGSPGLVEIELRHRVVSLVRHTPMRPGDVVVRASRVTLEIIDRAADESRLRARTAAALLAAGLALAPPEHGSERLCIDAGPDTVTLAWGTSSLRCEGRTVGLARSGIVARALVGDAMRLRDAAPLRVLPRAALSDVAPDPERARPSTAPASAPSSSGPAASAPSSSAPASSAPASSAPAARAPAARAPAASAPAASAPAPGAPSARALSASTAGESAVLVAVRGGAMARVLAIDPRMETSVLWQAFGTWGPMASLDVSGSLSPLLIIEGFVGAGVGGAWQVGEGLRVGAALLGGSWTHAWRFDDLDNGLAFDAAAVAPVWVDLRVATAVNLSLALEAGVGSWGRQHLISGVDAWSRGPFFLAITGGLTFDISPDAAIDEN